MDSLPLDPMVPQLYKIEKIRRETKDTFTFFLVPVEDHSESMKRATYSFKPGQFNMLYSFGAGEVPVSVSGSPLSKDFIVHTIRSVGGVTSNMEKLNVGDVIGVRGPYGNFWPIEEAQERDILIIAGGIGLAPLRPVIYTIIENRNKYGKVSLFYGGRSPDQLLFIDEIKEWRENAQIDVSLTVDTPSTTWTNHVGVVPSLLSRAPQNSQNSVAFICGPEVMMRFSVGPLLNNGLSPQKIFLSMERNMKCAVGFCGRCQYREYFICKDGPIFSWAQIHEHINKREL
ncbi:MAG: FAD/NAD(P)-binding protein [Pseudobdellovibrionaceae bacterium]